MPFFVIKFIYNNAIGELSHSDGKDDLNLDNFRQAKGYERANQQIYL